MTLNKLSLHKRNVFLRACAVIALSCVTVPHAPAMAQDSAGQLPSDVAQRQVPQTFPDAEAPAAAAQPAAAQEHAPEAPAVENPPAQPEVRKLVPATAMGVQARDAHPAPATAAAPTAPEMPDVLEQFTNKAAPAAQETSLATENGDALPQLDEATKMQLQANALQGNAVDQPVGTAVQGKTDEQLQEEIRTEAFDAAITGVFPLQPGQVKDLLKRYDQTQEAVETPIYDAPKPEISVQNISLDPGVLPPVIKTAVGNVTTLNMLDATGAPWPVQDVTWAGDYEVVEPEEGGHIVRITPMSQFARGNIVVRLLTLKTPLTMTLETGRDVVQYRVDARIPEYGPYANAPIMQGGKSTMVAGSPELTSVLSGSTSGEMVKLEVSGVDGRTTAYMLNGTTYVRTPLTLLSPAWQSSVSSADGMNVYALSNAPVLLLSDGGQFMRATLKEKKDLLDE